METTYLTYEIKDVVELNLSFIPFVSSGGLFVPTDEPLSLGDPIVVNLILPTKKAPLSIEGKVIWHTPKNSLHHVLPGIGIQFTGESATAIRTEIENNLDASMEVGGYVYGITESKKN